MTEIMIYDDEIVTCSIGDGNEGHIIVRPKGDYKSVDEISEEMFVHLSYVAVYASSILFEVFSAQGTNIIMNDFANQKLEIHVFSRKENDDLDFNWERKQMDEKELDKVASLIKDKCDLIGIEKPKEKLKDFDIKEELTDNIKLRRVP